MVGDGALVAGRSSWLWVMGGRGWWWLGVVVAAIVYDGGCGGWSCVRGGRWSCALMVGGGA